MDYIKAFIVGGLICIIGQIILDKTKITTGRILVIFVVLGCILGSLGIYEKLIDFAGAGATVPLPGFGYLLSKGVIDEVNKSGASGILTGALKASAGGISSAILFSFIASLFFQSKAK